MRLCFAEAGTHAHWRKRKAAEKRKFSAAPFDQHNRRKFHFSVIFLLKMNLRMILFTYLKFILLQYFQFQ